MAWRLFTCLIWLTLFTICSVTYKCNWIPIWKYNFRQLWWRLDKCKSMLQWKRKRFWAGQKIPVKLKYTSLLLQNLLHNNSNFSVKGKTNGRIAVVVYVSRACKQFEFNESESKMQKMIIYPSIQPWWLGGRERLLHKLHDSTSVGLNPTQRQKD